MAPSLQGRGHSTICDEHGEPLDYISKSMAVITHNEADLHNAYVWRSFRRASIASIASVSFLFIPGRIIDPQQIIHNWIVFNAFSNAALRISVYKSPVITSNGIELLQQNAVLCNASVPYAKIYHTPTLTSDGTLVDEIPGGASKESAIIPDLEEWQCSNIIMHLKVTNLDNSTQDITTRFRLSEHE